jgi:hypothetical protein
VGEREEMGQLGERERAEMGLERKDVFQKPKPSYILDQTLDFVKGQLGFRSIDIGRNLN